MKVVFYGYHGMGCMALDVLLERGAEVAAVFTHEDDGDENLWFPSLAAKSRAAGIPTYTPKKPGAPEWVEKLEEIAPDLILSVYYRKLLPDRVLRTARRGALNLHGSMLPKYRGRCPINWVLVNGETGTGVTLHHMVKRADAGAIVAQDAVAISAEDTALTLYRKLREAARNLLGKAYPLLESGDLSGTPQDEACATLFGGRKPEDGLIDWTWSASRIYNLIRAVTHPYPGAFTETAHGRLFVWWATPEAGDPGEPGTVVAGEDGSVRVATGDGRLRLSRVQEESHPEESGAEWAARRGAFGTRLLQGREGTES